MARLRGEMSRTIVHMPSWVLMHTSDVPTLEDHNHKGGVCHLKTLADFQQRYREGGKRRFYGDPQMPCEHYFAPHVACRLYSVNAPRTYRRSIWEKPARQHTQTTPAAARREYNSGLATDLEPEPYRTRNQANYSWS